MVHIIGWLLETLARCPVNKVNKLCCEKKNVYLIMNQNALNSIHGFTIMT